MIYPGAFATTSELKSRMGITDTANDAVLLEILKGTSGAIEAYVGHILRRQHGLRERINCHDRIATLQGFPVAEVHWVRESPTHDFDDPDNYTELVENEDYVLEPANITASPGQYGTIKRIGNRWNYQGHGLMGVEVCYTAGYRTPQEVAAESGTLTIDGATNTSACKSFSVALENRSGEEGEHGVQDAASTTVLVGNVVSSGFNKIHRGFVVFTLADLLAYSWQVTEATLGLYFNRSAGSVATSIDGFLIGKRNPLRMMRGPKLEELYEILDDAENQVFEGIANSSSTFVLSSQTLHSMATLNSASVMKKLNESIRAGGFIAFGFKEDTETVGTSLQGSFCSPTHATSGQRPSLVMKYQATIIDEYGTPDDLRHACLLQAAADFYTRKSGPFIQETQRGVSISSGISYTKGAQDLLPQVKKIADRYRRAY